MIEVKLNAMTYVVDLANQRAWVKKHGRNGRNDYLSTITSERKCRRLFKLAEAQADASFHAPRPGEAWGDWHKRTHTPEALQRWKGEPR